MDKMHNTMGAGMDDRERENDSIARTYLELANARMERMKISQAEALASTSFVLLYDYIEARRVGERTFVGEFDSRKEKGKKK